MKMLLLAMLVCATVCSTPAKQGAQLEKDIENGLLAERTEKALSNLLYKAADTLEAKGHLYEAQIMITEWENEYRYTFRSYAAKMSSRDIGDHEGWSKKLQEWLKMLEFTLGEQLMSATHLSDLIVFNSSNVCFRPCQFPMDNIPGERIDEYRRHMAEGRAYWGLIPVVSFWLCSASAGGAYVLMCSPVEMLVGKFVAGRVSDIVFHRACDF